ncbi:hypothetical protein V8E53_001721 [Lactarius tabidus]
MVGSTEQWQLLPKRQAVSPPMRCGFREGIPGGNSYTRTLRPKILHISKGRGKASAPLGIIRKRTAVELIRHMVYVPVPVFPMRYIKPNLLATYRQFKSSPANIRESGDRPPHPLNGAWGNSPVACIRGCDAERRREHPSRTSAGSDELQQYRHSTPTEKLAAIALRTLCGSARGCGASGSEGLQADVWDVGCGSEEGLTSFVTLEVIAWDGHALPFDARDAIELWCTVTHSNMIPVAASGSPDSDMAITGLAKRTEITLGTLHIASINTSPFSESLRYARVYVRTIHDGPLGPSFSRCSHAMRNFPKRREFCICVSSIVMQKRKEE